MRVRAPRLWIFLSSLEEAFFQQPARTLYRLRFLLATLTSGLPILLLLTMHRLARSCCLILNNPEKNYYQAPQPVQPIVSTR